MKKTRIVLLCMLILSVLITADLGYHFYLSTLSELNDSAAIHSVLVPLLFGGRTWTAVHFYRAFLCSAFVMVGLIVTNMALAISGLRTRAKEA